MYSFCKMQLDVAQIGNFHLCAHVLFKTFQILAGIQLVVKKWTERTYNVTQRSPL